MEQCPAGNVAELPAGHHGLAVVPVLLAYRHLLSRAADQQEPAKVQVRVPSGSDYLHCHKRRVCESYILQEIGSIVSLSPLDIYKLKVQMVLLGHHYRKTRYTGVVFTMNQVNYLYFQLVLKTSLQVKIRL